MASILLLDEDGRTVGATNRNLLGTNHPARAYFVEAQRTKDTVFSRGAARRRAALISPIRGRSRPTARRWA